MRKLMILSATVLLASTGGAFAEDNAELLQPVSFGVVTGDAEKDTMAYDVTAPSDLQVRFEKDCGARSAPVQEASLDAAAPTANPHDYHAPRPRMASSN